MYITINQKGFSKMEFKQIIDYIDNNDYISAEKHLSAIQSNNDNNEKDISIANYLMGYINTRWNNKQKSDFKAKQFLLNCIDSSYPIPDAFYIYAKIEEDKNIALNHLKKV